MPENAPTTPTAPTLNEQEKKSDRIYRFIISALCFAMCTVQIVNVIYPFFISSEFFVIHFMFGMLMCYLVYDYKGKKRYFYSPAKIFDIILALGVAAVAIYILRDIDAFLLRMDLVASPTDIVMGAICTVIVLEGCRRLTGPSLPAIALITILYALFGKYLLASSATRATALPASSRPFSASRVSSVCPSAFPPIPYSCSCCLVPSSMSAALISSSAIFLPRWPAVNAAAPPRSPLSLPLSSVPSPAARSPMSFPPAPSPSP